MSNQFSYELDERQIRILMQNAELDYDDSVWQKFSSIPVVDHKQSISVLLPKINIGISRSVIVPIFFVLMIGSLSALLFSFVDFKKKDEVIKEIPLTNPTITKKNIPTAPVTVKPKLVVTSPKDTVISTRVANAEVKALPEQQKNTEPIAKAIEPVIKPITTEPIVSERKEQKVVTQAIPKKKKKRNRKQITEELPIINARTTTLNEGSSEPELEIK